MGKIANYLKNTAKNAGQHVANRIQEERTQRSQEKEAYRQESNKARIQRAQDRAWEEQGYHKTPKDTRQKITKKQPNKITQLSNLSNNFTNAMQKRNNNNLFSMSNNFLGFGNENKTKPRKKPKKVVTKYYY